MHVRLVIKHGNPGILAQDLASPKQILKQLLSFDAMTDIGLDEVSLRFAASDRDDPGPATATVAVKTRPRSAPWANPRSSRARDRLKKRGWPNSSA